MAKRNPEPKPAGAHEGSTSSPPLSLSLEDNVKVIRSRLGNSPDLIIREYETTDNANQMAAVYINGIIDKERVEEFITHTFSFGILSEEKSA
ncbi:hypothetical protein D3C81_2001670 [compost metagenome]